MKPVSLDLGRRLLRRGVVAAFAMGALVAMSSAANVALHSHGISGFSGKQGKDCNQCHSGGTAPTVMLDGPIFVLHDTERTYTFTISGGQQIAGGLDVAIDMGTLDATESDTHIDTGEVTHNNPKSVDSNGNVAWDFGYIAPSQATNITIFAAGNSVNLNGNNRGDKATTTTMAVTVVDNLTSFVQFGQGLAGSGGITPELLGTDGPSVGPWSITLDQGLGGSFGYLWLGLGTADLFPFFGGHLYIDLSQLHLILPIVLGGPSGVAGAGSLTLPGTDVSAFAPLTLYFQGTMIDPAAPKGVSLTNALEMDVRN